MTENNYIKVDIKSFQDICKKVEQLEAENEFLQKQNKALRLRCSKYSVENRKLESEIADMKFTRKYLTGEEAGCRFAEELLGGA